MKRRTLLKGGALIGLAKIGDAMITAPSSPCVRLVIECTPCHHPNGFEMFKGAMRLDEFCKQQEELGRKVVHTHEEVEELSYAVVELTCSSRQEAMLLAQKISSDAGTDDLRERYGPICEIAYYEGNE